MRDMGKKVSFYKGGEFLVLNDDEEIISGAQILKNYFWFFTTHDQPTVFSSLRRSLACFYTCELPSPSVLEENGFEVERIDISVKVLDNIFFDERDRKWDFSIFESQKVVYIFVNGKSAGMYLVKNQVLIASDWTHNEKCIETLKQLIPYLSKIFRKRSKLPPKPRFSITVGADPEFEVIDSSGRVVSASGIVKGGTDPRQEIGRDGAGSQVELRPKPESDLWKFIGNVRSLLKKFAEEYPGYRLSTQGDVYPLGGHIHLSVPVNNDIIRILDNWIGDKVIHLSGKARGSYKKLSAYETKPWGFEYRTPPAAVFLKPQVLFAVLKIMKAVLKEYFSCEGVSLYPTPEEIARLKIEKEWKILNDFVKEYPKVSKDVLKQWRIKVKVEPRVDVIFRDDWAPEIRSYVSSLLSERLGKLAKKLNMRGIYKVILFGFRSERGMVCNFESTVFDKIDFDYSVNSGEKAFGLPYNVRVAELSDDLKKMWGVVAEEIIKALLK